MSEIHPGFSEFQLFSILERERSGIRCEGANVKKWKVRASETV
jgi:hypothetical protein